MPQFDIHRLADGLVINCQSDLLEQIDSRFVVPLVPRMDAPKVAARLNPVFEIDGKDYVMLTQAATAVRRRELGAWSHLSRNAHSKLQALSTFS